MHRAAQKCKRCDTRDTRKSNASLTDPHSNDTPLLWIRIDPDLDFLRTVVFRQPDFMWQHQLELERDVLAQYEAVRGLRAFPSKEATAALVQTVESERVFYRIRIEAAQSLAKVPRLCASVPCICVASYGTIVRIVVVSNQPHRLRRTRRSRRWISCSSSTRVTSSTRRVSSLSPTTSPTSSRITSRRSVELAIFLFPSASDDTERAVNDEPIQHTNYHILKPLC